MNILVVSIFINTITLVSLEVADFIRFVKFYLLFVMAEAAIKKLKWIPEEFKNDGAIVAAAMARTNNLQNASNAYSLQQPPRQCEPATKFVEMVIGGDIDESLDDQKLDHEQIPTILDLSTIPKVKVMYFYIKMRTDRINHTALFKNAEKKGKFNAENFNRMFYSEPVRGGKNKSSREHDEVISRTLPVLGFSVIYDVVTFKKKPDERHAIIYKKCNSITDNLSIIVKSFEDFARQYRRHAEDVVPVEFALVNNPSNLLLIGKKKNLLLIGKKKN